MVFDLQGFQQRFEENGDIADAIGKINITYWDNNIGRCCFDEMQPILGRLMNYYDGLDSFLRESWHQMTLDDKNAVINIISHRVIEIGNDISKDPKSKDHLAFGIPEMKYIMQYIPKYNGTITVDPMRAQNEWLILKDIMYAINTGVYERDFNPETSIE